MTVSDDRAFRARFSRQPQGRRAMYHDRQIAPSLVQPLAHPLATAPIASAWQNTGASAQGPGAAWLERGFHRLAEREMPRSGRRARDVVIGMTVAVGFSAACWTALACWYFG